MLGLGKFLASRHARAKLLRTLERLRSATGTPGEETPGASTPGASTPGAATIESLAGSLEVLSSRVESLLQQLRDERDQSVGVLSAMTDGVLLVDRAGRLELANSVAREWFALPETGYRGLLASRVLGGDSIAVLSRRAMEGAPASDQMELVFPVRRYLKMRALPAGGGALVVVHDATTELHVEELRRDFVINASHELKTPVAAIHALAESLEQALSDPQTARRFASRIQSEAARLARLISDLLDLSRVEAEAEIVEPVDLAEVVEGVREAFAEPARAAGVHLETDIVRTADVMGDRAQLALMVSNLVDNAVRYTSAGGSIAIRLASREAHVVLEIRDTGVGIPEAELPRVFERFYRVDRARSRATGGTGLGLSIVRHVAEGHGGRVLAQSELGRGSTFTVELPLAPPDSAPA
ncbi:MAG: ATP-binding protein [Actinomycetota bacterium]